MERKSLGYTLIEVLATTTVVAVLCMTAAPAMERMLAASSAERTLHRIRGALSYARTLAVMRGTLVTLCSVDGAGRCDGDWSGELVLFEDTERSAELSAGTEVLRRFGASRERILLRAFGTKRYFRYLPTGQTDWQNGRFVVCPAHPRAQARSVVVNVQGRAREAPPGTHGASCDP